MKIASQSPTELVVKDSTIWLAAVFGAAALATVYFSITQNRPYGLFGAAFFLLFAVAFARSTAFTFDGMQRVVRWNGYKPFKAVSGTIPFDEIADITVDVGMAAHNVPTYRLSLRTAKGATPLAFNYSGSKDGYAALRLEILAFIRPGLQTPTPNPSTPSGGVPAGLEASIRSLLLQRRKIDAIVLLRTHERMGLREAKSRIDALDARIKSESAAQQS